MRWAAGPSSPVSFVPFSSSGSGVRCYESLGPPATTWHEWYCRGFPCQMIQCGFALNKSHPTWASDFLIQTGTQVDCDINKCWCNWKSKSTPAAQENHETKTNPAFLGRNCNSAHLSFYILCALWCWWWKFLARQLCFASVLHRLQIDRWLLGALRLEAIVYKSLPKLARSTRVRRRGW